MRNQLIKIFLLITLALTPLFAFATHPKEIIIIRHGDKLQQTNPGSFLDAKGQVRAEKFAEYYIGKMSAKKKKDRFPIPNYIFATKPSHDKYGLKSIREIETLSPFVNWLDKKYPNRNYSIRIPYTNKQYQELDWALTHLIRYRNKTILICWDHKRINALIHSLGIKQKLPTWQSSDFDTVYIITYTPEGIPHLKRLTHQYPVHSNPSWKNLLHKQMSHRHHA